MKNHICVIKIIFLPSELSLFIPILNRVVRLSIGSYDLNVEKATAVIWGYLEIASCTKDITVICVLTYIKRQSIEIWVSQDRNFTFRKRRSSRTYMYQILCSNVICELTDTSPHKQSRIMIATAMFHVKWLLSCDVQRLTVDNDTTVSWMLHRCAI